MSKTKATAQPEKTVKVVTVYKDESVGGWASAYGLKVYSIPESALKGFEINSEVQADIQEVCINNLRNLGLEIMETL